MEIGDPFETYWSPDRDQVLVFFHFVQPKLVTPLPAALRGFQVGKGDMERVFLITLDTLSQTDFARLVAGAPEDRDGISVRSCLQEIVVVFVHARSNQADIVVAIG